jgi:hypothetical protein
VNETTSTAESVVLRTEDGASYVLPTSEFERAHLTDLKQIAEVRGQLATTEDQASASLLSGEVLAAHRLPDEQVAELEAAVAADTAGFTYKVCDIYWWGDHNYAYGAVITSVEGGTATLRAAYRVPLNLVAERALVLKRPGYGR